MCSVRDVQDYYLPNPSHTVARFQLLVAADQLVTLHFCVSRADVRLRLRVFEHGTETLVRAPLLPSATA